MELSMRKACRAQVSKVVNEANNLLSMEDFNINKALVQIVKIKSANDSLQKANSEAKHLVPADQMDEECTKILEYNEKTVVVIEMLEQRITEIQKVDNFPLGASASRTNLRDFENNGDRHQQSHVDDNTGFNNKMSVRLPKLELIKFNGNVHEWPAFWEQFDSAINSNVKLDDTTKFSYLKSVLLGNASVTIQGLTSSKTSYNNAIQLLKDEYGNKDKIIDSYIQQLLSFSSIKNKNDIISLRKLYNITLKITKSLQTLGIEPNTYGIMVKSIILKVLPYSLRIEFNKRYSSHESDINNEATSRTQSVISGNSNGSDEKNYEEILTRLLSFIKLEVDSVEQAQMLSEENTNDKFKDKFRIPRRNVDSSKGDGNFTAAGLFTGAREKCIFCNSDKHMTVSCNNVSVTLEKRKSILKNDARCFRCTKPNHNSRNCKTNIQCAKCKRKHATSMCDPEYEKGRSTNKNNNGVNNIEQKSSADRQTPVTNLLTNGNFKYVYLQTACAKIEANDPKINGFVRLVIDGGSQLTFIKECVSRQLDLPIIGSHKLSIATFGNKEEAPARICRRVSLKLKDVNEKNCVKIEAIEVPEICFNGLSPPSSDDPAISKFSKDHMLADNYPVDVIGIPGISLLIGADCYWRLVTGEIEKISDSQMAVNTKLGWTIHGANNDYGFSLNVNITSVFQVQGQIDEDDCIDIKKFWDLESIGIHEVDNVIQTNTKDFVQEKIIFNKIRYSTSLPWKDNNVTLDSNFNGALSRVKGLTSKLIRNKKLQEYDDEVREYVNNDCAERVPDIKTEKRIYYMPHRPVYREDKDTTKIRVVFDASAHAPEMPSLNDLLTPGENLVPLLVKVLINFRIGSVALIADVEKAFLQIEIDKEDRDSHSFLWYASPIKDVTVLPDIVKFRMKRVTFGVTCSPFLLAATLRKHLNDQPDYVRDICDRMLSSFYVDDLIVSLDSVEEALRIYVEGKSIMSKAGMNLRKWDSNSAKLKEIINIDCDSNTNSNIKKVLGMSWCPETDELGIDIQPVQNLTNNKGQMVTKRMILQAIAKIYDPLGLLSPFIIRAKLLMQQIWLRKFDWDSILPSDILEVWLIWCSEFNNLSKYYVPRCIMNNSQEYVELHIFSDASPQAYGAVAYLRTSNNLGIVSSNVLMAKNRVSPIRENSDRELTLPKLELTAALCATRLQRFILANLNISFKVCVLWTDSKIVLHWIQGKATKWKPYVCHRVTEIQNNFIGTWKHCPGPENPADMLTRGVKVKSLTESKLWQHGPEWLAKEKDLWPNDDTMNISNSISILAVQAKVKEKGNDAIFPIERYSSYNKLLRVTACMFRFILRLKKQKENVTTKYIIASEIIKSEQYWIKVTQKQYFENEVEALLKHQQINHDSRLLSLNPFLDENEVMRLGGRLQESLLSYEAKHPILLPKKSILTDHIIYQAHIVTSHGGVNATITQIRKRYWILQTRQRVKFLLNTCMKCKRLRSKPANEPFAPIPRDRLTAVSPFKITGVDFAGPLYVLSVNGRVKAYVMLMTCAVIRAVHLEVVPDLTTESCIRALRRFISRRGVPDVIYSDNAKTFKRTDTELKELSKLMSGEKIQNLATHHRIDWKFIVERASWWGGFWERLVKSVKDALKLSLGRSLINMDELQTTLAEIEAIINTRPLSYLHDDPEDLLILTPGHFLLGEYHCGFTIDPKLPIVSHSIIGKLWKERNKVIHKFFKCWSTSYLQHLRGAHMNAPVKQRSLKVGDIVLLHDQNLTRLQWKMVRVTKTFVGRDGKVRSCEILTSNKTTLKRPVQLLYPLEITAAGEDVENSLINPAGR